MTPEARHERPSVAQKLDEHERQMRQDFPRQPCAQCQQLRQALKAAAQFIYPEIDRGPFSNGWQLTVELVEAALAALPPETAQGVPR